MRTIRLIAAVACAHLAAALVAAQAPAAGVALGDVLARAAIYVSNMTTKFVDVVAEERYLQQAQSRTTVARTGRSTFAIAVPSERRELVSDFLLVKVQGTEFWVPFRDVFQVDGKPVRDREDRLSKLLLHPSSEGFEQARRIADESARYNIGNVQRTINMPLLALVFVDPDYQPRFRYSLGKEDPSVGPGVWVVNYQERAHPTVVRGTNGKDLNSSGRVWVEAATGRVPKTEHIIQDGPLRAIITTSFRPDDRFGFDVPFEMVEDYMLADGTHISGRASYARFRRFDVTAVEAVAASPSRWLTEPSTGMVLVEIPAGQFAMGSPTSESGRGVDETIHDVAIGAPYYLGRFEVTAQEWRTVMGSTPSRFADCGPRCPVDNVSFEDVQKFLAKLNAGPTHDLRYRLPTEAEWEYACRAGTASPFSTGASITTDQANYDGRRPYAGSAGGASRGRPTPVDSFAPNPWGLADMHGNVWEWTADWYGPYEDGAARDPHGPSAGTERAVRGGSWEVGASSLRCALRSSRPPRGHAAGLGFRVAADLVRQP